MVDGNEVAVKVMHHIYFVNIYIFVLNTLIDGYLFVLNTLSYSNAVF